MSRDTLTPKKCPKIMNITENISRTNVSTIRPSRCVRNLPRIILGKVKPSKTKQKQCFLRIPEKSENPKNIPHMGVAPFQFSSYVLPLGNPPSGVRKSLNMSEVGMARVFPVQGICVTCSFSELYIF